MRESTTATNEVGTRTGGRIGRVARWFALLLLVAGFVPAIGWAGAFFDIIKVAGDGAADPNSIVRLTVRLDGPPLTFPADVFFEVRQGNADFVDAGKPGFIAVPAQVGTNLASVDLAVGRGSDPIVVFVIANGWRPNTFNIQPRGPEQVTAGGGNNQVGIPGQPGQPLEVLVTQDGLPVAGETVFWDVIAGRGVTLSGTSSTTDAAGHAQIGITFGVEPSSAIVQATTARGTFTNFDVSSRGVAGVTLSVASGSNQTGATGSLADQPIVFSAQDTAGAPVGGLLVELAVVAGSGTLEVDGEPSQFFSVASGEGAGPNPPSGVRAISGRLAEPGADRLDRKPDRGRRRQLIHRGAPDHRFRPPDRGRGDHVGLRPAFLQ